MLSWKNGRLFILSGFHFLSLTEEYYIKNMRHTLRGSGLKEMLKSKVHLPKERCYKEYKAFNGGILFCRKWRTCTHHFTTFALCCFMKCLYSFLMNCSPKLNLWLIKCLIVLFEFRDISFFQERKIPLFHSIIFFIIEMKSICWMHFIKKKVIYGKCSYTSW